MTTFIKFLAALSLAGAGLLLGIVVMIAAWYTRADR